jgi:hypothetical protein
LAVKALGDSASRPKVMQEGSESVCQTLRTLGVGSFDKSVSGEVVGF